MRTTFPLLALALGCAGPGRFEPADLIVHHAKVITVDAAFSIAEAVAVKDGRVVAVGSDEEIFRHAGPATRVIDAEGHPLLPGLFDSHVHLLGASTSEMPEPLPKVASLEEAFAFIRGKAASTPDGGWIVLRYAFPTRLKEARFPTRAELDAAAPRHPVLYHAGPAGMTNSKGLEVSGITKDTPHPPNGQIVKDPKTGEPTGMLRNAYGALKGVPAAVAVKDVDVQRDAIRKLLALYNTMGITSVADRNAPRETLDHLRALSAGNQLTCRVNVALAFDPKGSREDVGKKFDALPGPTGAGDDWVRVGPIKLFLDGGMLNGSAYMREPWPAGPTYQVVEHDYKGLLFIDPAQLRVVLEEGAKRGWQMTAHTAGEGAMDVLLDAYEAVGGIRGKRWCITHANFPSRRNLERCRALGVTADVQPAWLFKDGATLLKELGSERMKWFQPYKSWLQYTTIGGGSDHMIRLDDLDSTNPWNPWLGMWATIARKTERGPVLNPEEKLTREEAIRLYTINNAYLHHEEALKGSLEIGKLADFILVDRDPLTCPLDALPDTRVLGTFVGGREVYAR
ncbi:MAG TPA: amidohydrolase [Planctomycetota bacterium]